MVIEIIQLRKIFMNNSIEISFLGKVSDSVVFEKKLLELVKH